MITATGPRLLDPAPTIMTQAELKNTLLKGDIVKCDQ